MQEFLAQHALWIFVLVTTCSFFLTWCVRVVAIRFSILDHPSAHGGRKQHKKPTPLLGGVSIYVTFAFALSLIVLLVPSFTWGEIRPKYVVGILLAGLILIVGGVWDDIRDLSPKQQVVFPLLSSFVVIASGVGVEVIRNPFGLPIDLGIVHIELFSWNGVPYFFVLFADLFAFIWILVSTYATKFLDGVDGLVSGVAVIAGIILFAFSVVIPNAHAQPETALIALVFAGSVLGFLFWNLPFPRARMFLGEGGSVFVGFMLAVLSIIYGAKLATTLLLLGLPLIDMFSVIVQRLSLLQSPFKADRKHLHFRLLDLFSGRVWSVLSVLWGVVLIFGVVALTTEGRAKAAALVLLVFVVVFMGILAWSYQQRMHGKKGG